MAKYYVRWQLNPQLIPLNPEERTSFGRHFLNWSKRILRLEKIKDWELLRVKLADMRLGKSRAKRSFMPLI